MTSIVGVGHCALQKLIGETNDLSGNIQPIKEWKQNTRRQGNVILKFPFFASKMALKIPKGILVSRSELIYITSYFLKLHQPA